MTRRTEAWACGLSEIEDGDGHLVAAEQVSNAIAAVVDFYEAQMPPPGSVVIPPEGKRMYSTCRFNNEHRMSAWVNQHREIHPISFGIDDGIYVLFFYTVKP